MTMTDDDVAAGAGEPVSAARAAVRELAEAGLLDKVMDRAEAGELALTGEGGFLPEMVKAVLERGLAAELTGHLGYDKGDPAGRGSPNSRNGSSPKTLATEIGPVPLDVPRDRNGSFEPRLVPKGTRRAGGLDEMTIRDIAITWPARSAPSCRTTRSPGSPTRSLRRSRPGRPARWKSSTRSSTSMR